MHTRTFQLAENLHANRLGYGAMRLCGQPGNFGPYRDIEQGKRLLRLALDLGVNFIDTADAYGPGDNETLIADALHPYPAHLIITTKGGVVKTSAVDRYPNGSSEYLRSACETSLRRLRVERIDLYQLHRPDPLVSFEESVGALAGLKDEGKIRLVGLSNVSLGELKRAQAITPIASVQNRFSLADRSSEALVDHCATHSIAFLPYGPLGADAMKQGAPLAEGPGSVGAVARALGATPSQVALAWLLERAPNIIVIPGTTSESHLRENVGAARVHLTGDHFAELSKSS